MHFIYKLIKDDEKVLLTSRLHWIYLVNGAIWMLFGFLIGWCGNLAVLYYFHRPAMAVFYLFAGGGVVVFLTTMVLWFSSIIVLTNRRLLYKRGFFTVKFEEIGLDEIRGEHIKQGFIGHIMNFGAIHFDCRLVDDLEIPTIDDPYGLSVAVVGARKEFYLLDEVPDYKTRPSGANEKA